MRILFLTSRLPFPPDRGDRLRAFNIIKHLSANGHEIHLASFVSGPKEREIAGSLRTYCKSLTLVARSALSSWLSCARRVPGGTPLQAAYYESPGMARAVRDKLAAGDFDLVYVHLFRMAQYVPARTRCYKLIDFTDVISREVERSLPYRRGLNRLVYSAELPRIRAYETSLAGAFDECWVVSQAEADALREMSGSADVRVIPNGVDLERFKPLDVRPSNIVTFVGHLGVPHNVDAVLHFYDDIFRAVRRERPDCRFCVIGPALHPSLKRLKRDRQVIVMGFVEDLNASLNRSSVFVAPLRYCAGLQNKVLEAMAAGVPVVATPCVNEGLGAKDDEEIALASEPWEFAARVVTLMEDAPLQRYISANGRKFVEKNFAWRLATDRIAEIAAERRRAG
ncbi:MAG: glycosyltransferase [Candidatus Eisenbacteria bacterium]|nr:glycosyltransferase [Candidatus Eisenbacteria bacterium]